MAQKEFYTEAILRTKRQNYDTKYLGKYMGKYMGKLWKTLGNIGYVFVPYFPP